MLNKDVYEYFINLDKSNLKKKKGAFVCDNKINISDDKARGLRLFTIDINNYPYYIKHWGDKTSVFATSSSNLYNHVGIITPPIYKIYHNEKNKNYEISQDAESIEGYNYIFAIPQSIDTFNEIMKKSKVTDDKWAILQKPEIIEKFMSFMTRECFEEYIAHFILSELRTDVDCHAGNYLLYKEKNSTKFQGLMPIDLELGEILYFSKYSGDNFKDFLDSKYSTFTPSRRHDLDNNYKFRLEAIRELILDGHLSTYQTGIIKKALDYDFPNDIRKTFKKFKEEDPKHKVYDIISRLWDYNQTLQRDL